MGQNRHCFIPISGLLQNFIFLIVRNFLLIYFIFYIKKNLCQQDTDDSYYK